MELKYKIYAKSNLLVDVLSGDIHLNSLFNLHNAYRQDQNISCVKKVLSNVLSANFHLNLEEMQTYINVLKNESYPSNFKWAILTNQANATMFSMLIKDDPTFRNIVEIFCTFEGSLRYLNINYSENQFFENDYINVKY